MFRWDGDHLRIDFAHATALFTTRAGGVSSGPYASLNLGGNTDDAPDRVAENRRRAAALAGGVLQLGRQVHGTRLSAGEPGEADGQIARRRGVVPTVLVADCLPIVLVGEDAVAVLHGGWRGLAGGIVAAGVAALGTPLRAAIGPGAGPCCYEVGDEVRAHFDARHHRGRHLDLKAAAAALLADAGVAEVHDCGLCTLCDERFFSHRRERGITGRQAGMAWLS